MKFSTLQDHLKNEETRNTVLGTVELNKATKDIPQQNLIDDVDYKLCVKNILTFNSCQQNTYVHYISVFKCISNY